MGSGVREHVSFCFSIESCGSPVLRISFILPFLCFHVSFSTQQASKLSNEDSIACIDLLEVLLVEHLDRFLHMVCRSYIFVFSSG